MQKGQHTFSAQMDQAEIDKVNEIVGYAKTNGLRISDGLLIRAVIEHLRPSPELLGLLARRKQFEDERRKERRSSSSPKSAS